MTRIKLVKSVVALVGAIVLVTPLRAQDTLQLTLDKALEIALSESLTLKVADMEIKKSE